MMRLPDRHIFKKNFILCLVVLGGLVVFGMVFNSLKVMDSSRVRYIQHLQESDRDPSVGETTVNEDGTVDVESFATHLPLVILDTHGIEIPDIVAHTEDESKIYRDETITDPYIPVSLTLIDGSEHVNRLDGLPEFTDQGLIKLRGNSSRGFEKKQYGIKLLDESGLELEYPLLGMEADEDWILCNSIADATYIRSYLAYNLGGLIFPYTPDVRFCEVVFKDGDTYQYQGLYLLMETIKKASGRVDIKTYTGNTSDLSYLLCRDRYDHTSTMLSTYASDQQLVYGWYDLRYPKNELADEATVRAINQEVSEIEEILLSEDPEIFAEYQKVIDVDSFVDYFVFHEFLMNYDAGMHSTFYYRDASHRFSAGPIWDFDGCLDNYYAELADPEMVIMTERPLYHHLIRDNAFCNRIISRYRNLRQSILSDEFLDEFVQGTVDFLGNAACREESRWRLIYNETLAMEDGELNGFTIPRVRQDYQGEVERMVDMVKIHGNWMDEGLSDSLYVYTVDAFSSEKEIETSWIAVLMIVIFITTVSMVVRMSKGGVK